MDKRTSAALAKLAGRVLETGRCSPREARRLAASVLTQVVKPPVRAARVVRRAAKKKA